MRSSCPAVLWRVAALLPLCAALAAVATAAPAEDVAPSSGGSSSGVMMWGSLYDQNPATPPTSAIPVPLPGCLPRVAQIAAGIHHACFLLANGSLACIGSNSVGQCGTGLGSPAWLEEPVVVEGGPYRAVTAGWAFTCALLVDGAVECFGNNAYGELGDGTTREAASPAPSAAGFAFSQISAGGTHVCGIDSTTSRAFCWGSNIYGELGNGAALVPPKTDTDPIPPGTASGRSITPVPVVGGLQFVQISAGVGHTCGRTEGSGTWCWGGNDSGQLGNRTWQPTVSSTPLRVAGGHDFVEISAGYEHTCGRVASGQAFCFGLNNPYQQLGMRPTAATLQDPAFSWDRDYNSAVPVPVERGISYSQIKAGFGYTCGVAANGTAYCFGGNTKGEGGNGGGSGYALPPTEVYGQYRFASIATSVSARETAVTTFGLLQAPSPEPPQAEAPVPGGSGGAAGMAPMPDSGESEEGAGAAAAAAAAEGGQAASPPPVGAIVGGVLGGAACSALVAWLVLGPARRRLRFSKSPAEIIPANPKPVVPLMPYTSPPTLTTMGSTHSSQASTTLLLPDSYLTAAAGTEPRNGHGAARATAGAANGGWGAAGRQGNGQYAQAGGGATSPHLPRGSSEEPDSSGPQHASHGSAVTEDGDPELSQIAAYVAAVRQRCLNGPAGASSPSRMLGGAGACSPSRALTGPGVGRSASGRLSGPVQQWECAWEEIRLMEPVGRGSFGKVYRAEWRAHQVACKILMQPREGHHGQEGLELSTRTLRKLQEEAEVMCRIRSPHCLGILALCALPPCIITDYCSNGALYDLLKAAHKKPQLAARLTWPRRLQFALDAATGLHYLHTSSPAIIHRDVKSPNLLVDEHWRVKVADFNMSKFVEEQLQLGLASSVHTVNPIWQAPEVLAGEPAQASADVYSFGLVLFELLTWRLPWAGSTFFQIAHLVLNGQRPAVPPRGTLPGGDTPGFRGLQAFCDLMRECWAQAAGDRPSFASIVPRLRQLLEESTGGGG